MSEAIRYKKFESTTAVNTALKDAIAAAIAGAMSARVKLQIVLCAAEAHYLAHGDYTLINELVVGVDNLKGYNAAPMVKHVEKHVGLTRTPIVTDAIAGKTEQPKGFNGHTGKHSLADDAKLGLIAGAQAEMWWDTLHVASAFEAVVAEKILTAALNKIEKKRTAAIAQAVKDGKDPSAYFDGEYSPGFTQRMLKAIGVDRAIIAANEVPEAPELAAAVGQ